MSTLRLVACRVDFKCAHGEPPSAAFWGHSYDATNLLLDAIDAASTLDGDVLAIDRAAVLRFMHDG